MEEPKSRSQLKREVEALQKLGVDMIDMSPDLLDKIPLTDPLRKAIDEAKSIRSHGAKRRQAQLIGKLMRAADTEAIMAAFDELLAESKAQTYAFHQLEQWRERLVNEGNTALTEFVETYQPEDIQQLRQLIKKAVDDQKKGKNTGASKALFRYLRSCI